MHPGSSFTGYAFPQIEAPKPQITVDGNSLLAVGPSAGQVPSPRCHLLPKFLHTLPACLSKLQHPTLLEELETQKGILFLHGTI